tara:strand:+ start:13762 stop:14832 length:1071 start_codon:yes stop_codon:yes gene_type:complete
MATLIMPCGGRSSRFPNSRPKWSLTHPNGNLMLIESIQGLNLTKYEQIIFVFIKEDLKKNQLKKGITKAVEKLDVKFRIVELSERTFSQSETVSKAIKKLNIKGSILVKDCDGYFEGKFTDENFVYVSSLRRIKNINAGSKSYVDIDTNAFIKTIVEKDVISNLFCCGGYGFVDAQKFVKTYEKLYKLSDKKSELYISHIIYQQILDGEQFTIKKVKNFKDWGTMKDWNRYKNQYKTLFLDLDGVMVENSGEYIGKIWGSTKALEKNKDFINKLYDSKKVRIIFTTARKSEYKQQTLNQLKKLGIKYHEIIFDLMHAQRIVINDFSSTNSFPSAKGINIPRNSDNLEEYMSENFDV